MTYSVKSRVFIFLLVIQSCYFITTRAKEYAKVPVPALIFSEVLFMFNKKAQNTAFIVAVILCFKLVS